MNGIGKALSKITQLGISMLVPILLCLFIGKWLDDKFDTNILFLAIFIFLGVGTAFRNLYVMVIKDYNKEEKKEKENDYK